ncbi:hypothetical protein ACFC60_40200 [Kitasatospora purpeofusca]|uniref:hypothetical protein n=1 Tax=Kitasatospora purpeofusca TaxID=67352 RepID=UPI0035DD958B
MADALTPAQQEVLKKLQEAFKGGGSSWGKLDSTVSALRQQHSGSDGTYTSGLGKAK